MSFRLRLPKRRRLKGNFCFSAELWSAWSFCFCYRLAFQKATRWSRLVTFRCLPAPSRLPLSACERSRRCIAPCSGDYVADPLRRDEITRRKVFFITKLTALERVLNWWPNPRWPHSPETKEILKSRCEEFVELVTPRWRNSNWDVRQVVIDFDAQSWSELKLTSMTIAVGTWDGWDNFSGYPRHLRQKHRKQSENLGEPHGDESASSFYQSLFSSLRRFDTRDHVTRPLVSADIIRFPSIPLSKTLKSFASSTLPRSLALS